MERKALLEQLLPGAELHFALSRERERIAQDMHDGLAQHLAHVLHKLEFIQHLLEEQQPQQALAETQRAYCLLETGMHDLRQSISALLPEQAAESGMQDLVGRLRSLLDAYQASDPGLTIDCAIHELYLLPVLCREPVFRMIQEALNNIRKHARATLVCIHIHVLAKAFLVEIRDNGCGFQLEQALGRRGAAGTRIGLLGMRARIQEVGGCWEIQSRPGMGTIVRAHFPR